MSSLKILICGDVEGHINQLYQRIDVIQKKSGQFDVLFCVGDFFGDDDSEWVKYMSGDAKVPISTFILGPTKTHLVKYFPSPDGCELCDNVTFLGKRGLYTGTSGLQVAYLSGLESTLQSTTSSVQSVTEFRRDDVIALRDSLSAGATSKGIDLLLTSIWPKGVQKYANAPDQELNKASHSSLLSQLDLILRPRYHFCAHADVHYERLPYRNHRVLIEQPRHVTRFIALAKISNAQRKKYLYAFTITPLSLMEEAELVKQPSDVTECPFKVNPEALKSTAELKPSKSDQYFYDADVLERNSCSKRGGKRGRDWKDNREPMQKKQPQPTGPCWFCLGSPEVEKHLVVSVGTQVYLALAKGGLTPDHVLILPIGHHQSLVSAPSDIVSEIDQYKNALMKYFKSQGKVAVFFERNYKTQHLQIQVVPLLSNLVADLKQTFLECAARQDFELQEIPTHSDIKQIVPEGAPYFYAELPNGDKLLYRITKGFPLNFGREVLTERSLLDMPDKVDWRNCKYSKEEETIMASDFRQNFAPSDFTL